MTTLPTAEQVCERLDKLRNRYAVSFGMDDNDRAVFREANAHITVQVAELERLNAAHCVSDYACELSLSLALSWKSRAEVAEFDLSTCKQALQVAEVERDMYARLTGAVVQERDAAESSLAAVKAERDAGKAQWRKVRNVLRNQTKLLGSVLRGNSSNAEEQYKGLSDFQIAASPAVHAALSLDAQGEKE